MYRAYRIFSQILVYNKAILYYLIRDSFFVTENDIKEQICLR